MFKSVSGLNPFGACKPQPWSEKGFEENVAKLKATMAVFSAKEDGVRVTWRGGKLYCTKRNNEIVCAENLLASLRRSFGKLDDVCCELISIKHGAKLVDGKLVTINNNGCRFDHPGQKKHLFYNISGVWNHTTSSPLTLSEFESHLRLVALYTMKGDDAHQRKLALSSLPRMTWSATHPGQRLYTCSLVVQVLWEFVRIDQVVDKQREWERLVSNEGATPCEGFIVELVLPKQKIQTWQSGNYRDASIWKYKNVQKLKICIVGLVDESGIDGLEALVNIFTENDTCIEMNVKSLPLSEKNHQYVKDFFIKNPDWNSAHSPRAGGGAQFGGHADPRQGVPGQGMCIRWYLGHRQMRWLAVMYLHTNQSDDDQE